MNALVGFIAALAILLIMSRWSLWVAMFAAGFVLGFLAIPHEMWEIIYGTLLDPSVLLLTLAVGLIPIIGGIMDRRGLMESLVNNLRIGKKPFLMFSPALVGMLPMPGGALLSAPLVQKGGRGVPDVDKVAINVWYRHALYLVYPLSTSLIVGAKIAGLEIYTAIPYLMPFFFLLLVVGYIFFVRFVRGRIDYSKAFSLRGLAIPLGIIMVAPVLDFTLLNTIDFAYREISLVIAVTVSLALALYISRIKIRGIKKVTKKMRPWRFALIVMGMFVFLNIFKESGAPELISDFNPPKVVLLVLIGFLLGFATGRIQLPITIIIPIYMTNFTVTSMEPVSFAVMYFSVFLGYLISPVHPCNTVSIEYFKVSLKDYFKRMWPSIASTMIFMIIVGALLL